MNLRMNHHCMLFLICLSSYTSCNTLSFCSHCLDIQPYVSLFTTSKTSVVCRIKFINILANIPVWWLVFVLVVLHINCAFMGNLKDVPHFLCRCTFWDPKKFIRIQSISDDILCNAIILSLFTFTLSPLGPRFLNESIIFFFNFRNKWAIYNSILDSSINWLKKDFHSNLPELIVQSTKQRWPVYWSTSPKGSYSAI